jgi:hypothetical protein
VKKILLGAALAAAVLAPAASASRPHRVKLAIVALPKSALGAAGRSLAVSPESGVVSNAGATNKSIAGGPSTFDKFGRITGYDLSYGDPYNGGSGITAIETGVDKYKTSAGAKRGLAFWRKDDPKINVLGPYGVAVTITGLKPSKVGTRRFAQAATYAIPNAAPVSLVDEQFTDGRYVLQVDVAAGSISAAFHLAGKLARTLDHRLRLAEAGQLRGKSVKLPPLLDPGPPPGGPDLGALALTSSDFGGQATITDQGYGTPSTPSLSTYVRDMQPAGSFAELAQVIDWFPHANQATVLGRFEGVGFAYGLGEGLLTGVPGQFTPVDLSAVGHNAYGGVVGVTPPGQSTVYFVIISLSSGQAADLILGVSESQVQSADVVNLAQVAANRLDAGLAG